jgi:hypothetical protein
MSAKSKRAPGRPEGAKNIQYDHGEVHLSRCRKCDSTEIGKPFGPVFTVTFAGVHQGKPYTHIVRRKAACSHCGQHRQISTYENRKGKSTG